eukprot:Gb_24209 [translate_table: standard]
MALNTLLALAGIWKGGNFLHMDYVDFGTFWWWTYAAISTALVLFAGIMSGLTLGLMSLGLVDLEVLQRSGTPLQKKQAGNLRFEFDELGAGQMSQRRVLSVGFGQQFESYDMLNAGPNLMPLVNLAAAIFPVVQKQHQLLVTLLLCNAIAMEANHLSVRISHESLRQDIPPLDLSSHDLHFLFLVYTFHASAT